MRDQRLDTLRGLFLVIITIDHFDGWLQEITWQTFGFVSAAEGFVFLAGYMFALVNSKYLAESRVLCQRARKRATQIYLFHLLPALLIPLLGLLIPLYGDYWQAWVSPYYTSPLAAIAGLLLLLHQPVAMSVLPMYVFFVLLSPLVLRWMGRGKAKQVLAVSFSFWLLGQWLAPFHGLLHVLNLGFQEAHFNWFSWQLIYISGLWCGYRVANRQPVLPKQQYWWLICIGLAISLFVVRQAAHLGYVSGAWLALDAVETNPITHVHNLGWLRLLDFYVLAALFALGLQKLSPQFNIGFLALLGRNSLQVFAFHILLLYLTLPIGFRFESKLGHIGFAAYMAAIIASLALPAWFAERYKSQQ